MGVSTLLQMMEDHEGRREGREDKEKRKIFPIQLLFVSIWTFFFFFYLSFERYYWLSECY